MRGDQVSALRDPIFKGATRPAMKMGVPLVPLMSSFLSAILLGMWATVLSGSIWPLTFAAAFFIALLVTMQNIAKKDDQRFRQIGLAIRLHGLNRLKGRFHAITYSPYRFKRRR